MFGRGRDRVLGLVVDAIGDDDVGAGGELLVELGQEVGIAAGAVVGDGEWDDGGEVLFQGRHDQILKNTGSDAVRAFAEAADEAEGGPLVGVEFGDGGNRALVRGIVQGRDFHQPPADDAEDIEEAVPDDFGLGAVELALPCEADPENEVGGERGIGKIR